MYQINWLSELDDRGVDDERRQTDSAFEMFAYNTSRSDSDDQREERHDLVGDSRSHESRCYPVE